MPHFHSVSTNGSHPFSTKERPYLGNSTYTFTVLLDQKRGAQVPIYRWYFLKISHKMLVEKISTPWRSQIVFKASGRVASWLCGHMAGPGAGTVALQWLPPKAYALRALRSQSRELVALVDLPSCLTPTQWAMEATSS